VLAAAPLWGLAGLKATMKSSLYGAFTGVIISIIGTLGLVLEIQSRVDRLEQRINTPGTNIVVFRTEFKP